MLRSRGALATDLANGSRVTGWLGLVSVSGLAEDGPATFADTTGTGPSLGEGWRGVAWKAAQASLPQRVDVNYDWITSDDADRYERDLDMVNLRMSCMF